MNKRTPDAAGRILRVALDTPLRRAFDYLPPRDGPAAVAGVRVEVPFGSRSLVGIVLEVAADSDLPPARLRAAHAVLDREPVLDAATFELVRWAADYYHHPVGEAYAAALPTLLRAGRPADGERDPLALHGRRARGRDGRQPTGRAAEDARRCASCGARARSATTTSSRSGRPSAMRSARW